MGWELARDSKPPAAYELFDRGSILTTKQYDPWQRRLRAAVHRIDRNFARRGRASPISMTRIH
jgi:hypothetical protein